MPQLNYLYTNPAWEYLLQKESHVTEKGEVSHDDWGLVSVLGKDRWSESCVISNVGRKEKKRN